MAWMIDYNSWFDMDYPCPNISGGLVHLLVKEALFFIFHFLVLCRFQTIV